MTERDYRRYAGIRVIEVPFLGEEAVLVKNLPMKILLMDSMLSADARMDIMEQLMGAEEAIAS